MKNFFKYIEHFWLGNDGKPSIRRLLGIGFSIDLIINFHKAGGIVTKIVALIATEHALDSQVLLAIGGLIANIAMIIGIEAGLVAALFSLTTYQNIQFNKADSIQNIGTSDDNVPAGQLPT